MSDDTYRVSRLTGLPRVRITARDPDRIAKLKELGARGGDYLTYEEDITTPWGMDGVTCNEILAGIEQLPV